MIIPREDGYIRFVPGSFVTLVKHALTPGRLYTQLDVSQTGPIAASRQAKEDASFAEAGGRVAIETVTPEEVLEQANRIFAPYKLKFSVPLSWFAIWKSESSNAMSDLGFGLHIVTNQFPKEWRAHTHPPTCVFT